MAKIKVMIYIYTTFHLNQTFYTLLILPHLSSIIPQSSWTILLSFGSSFCFPEPHSVILNEVKDLHAQFGVSCPVKKESKNARSRHEKMKEQTTHCHCNNLYRFFAALRMTKQRCLGFDQNDKIKMSRLRSEWQNNDISVSLDMTSVNWYITSFTFQS